MAINQRIKVLLEVLLVVFMHTTIMSSSLIDRAKASQGHHVQKRGPTYRMVQDGNRTYAATDTDEEESIKEYNQKDIQLLYYNLKQNKPMLLVFDGSRFLVYVLGEKKVGVGRRYTKLVPLLVHALVENQPERFQSGQPVFQMVFTVSDFLLTECANEFANCHANKLFPPIVSFSSVYRDKSILPSSKSFPNPDYSGRLYDWVMGNSLSFSWPAVDDTLQWNQLENQLVWRGSDHRFFLPSFDEYHKMDVEWLEKVFTREALANMTESDVIMTLFHHYGDLSPRWKAVALTLKSKVLEPNLHPWINVLFTGNKEHDLHARFAERGIAVTDSKEMSSISMSKYKYQIDLAGGGGTTWQGTLTKLRMPGVLFHHETPTHDWFYNIMEPWVHYIPVQTDLGDLRSRYQWAEEHPEQAKMIAEESSRLANYLLSAEYLNDVYEQLFVRYLGKVVAAFQPQGMSWNDCLKQYHEEGIRLHLASECGLQRCISQWGPGNAAVDIY